MQKFICVGNLTKTPELRETPNGKKITPLTVAINRYGEGVDYFNAIVWGAQAENCVKYLDKGCKVAIVGEMQNRSYNDKDGVKRIITEIQVREIEFLSYKNSEKSENASKPTLTEVAEDNLPF